MHSKYRKPIIVNQKQKCEIVLKEKYTGFLGCYRLKPKQNVTELSWFTWR